MAEKCPTCGKYLSYCYQCNIIYCANCDNGASFKTECPKCGSLTNAGNVTETHFKTAKRY